MSEPFCLTVLYMRILYVRTISFCVMMFAMAEIIMPILFIVTIIMMMVMMIMNDEDDDSTSFDDDDSSSSSIC